MQQSLLVFKSDIELSEEKRNVLSSHLNEIGKSMGVNTLLVENGDATYYQDLSKLVEAINNQTQAVINLTMAIAESVEDDEDNEVRQYLDGSPVN